MPEAVGLADDGIGPVLAIHQKQTAAILHLSAKQVFGKGGDCAAVVVGVVLESFCVDQMDDLQIHLILREPSPLFLGRSVAAGDAAGFRFILKIITSTVDQPLIIGGIIETVNACSGIEFDGG